MNRLLIIQKRNYSKICVKTKEVGKWCNYMVRGKMRPITVKYNDKNINIEVFSDDFYPVANGHNYAEKIQCDKCIEKIENKRP